MRKITIVLLIIIGYCVKAQTNCASALPFCAGGVSGVTFPATTGTPATQAEQGPNYGCLGSQPNPAWYFLQISQTGSLNILIQGQATSPPGPGQDVDFICWGPFSSLAGICNSLTAANTIDCSYSASYTETLNIVNGVSGQYYMVLITNYANVPQNIIFTQFSGDGTTNCNLVAGNARICAGSSATIVATNSGSLTNPSYSMNPGGITNSTGSFVVSPSVTTNYSLYIHGTNSSSVAVTQTAASTVSVDPQPSVAPTVTNTTCTSTLNAFNLGLSFFPSTSPPSYTVSWASIPNGVGSNTQTALGGTNVSIPAGPYTATITSVGGCSTVANFTLNPVPAPAVISLLPLGNTFSITCYQPTINITAQIATNNYTWSNNGNAPFSGSLAAFTNTMTGTWTVLAVNAASSCTASQTLAIGINTLTPTSVLSPTFQNITCSLSSIATVTATASPSVNVTNIILSPQGGTFSAQSYTTTYLPGGVGVYTNCAVNDINGCSTCHTFSVVSSMGFPTYSVTSPDSFTLGCSSKSVATINIINSNTSPPGGPVSYTLIGPPTSASTPTGVLSGNSTYTVNVPGTWTVITKDNTSFCETRTPISILSNTLSPDLSVVVPRLILDCFVPKTTLIGQSTNTNVGYLWSFPGNPGTLQSDSVVVSSNSLAPTSSVIANYTLTITDNSSTCKSFSVVPMVQNLYPPVAGISATNPSLTCSTATIVLTNQSHTGIPPGSIFPTNAVVQGYIWDGPTPQEQGQVQTTYIAATTGVYTLTARDLNNGCFSTTTINIGDNRVYPSLNRPTAPDPFPLDCGVSSRTIAPFISGPTTGFTYTWTGPPGAAVSGASTSVLTASLPGIYKVLTTNTLNGCSASAEVSLVSGTLNGNFTASQDSGYAPLQVMFENSSSSTLGSANINSYWNFGNGTTSTSDTASTIFTQPGNYTVTLFVTKGACLDTVYHFIRVDIPSAMEVPNIFTPNGDNVNDLFFLKASNLKSITMQIFDRWGHVVFDTESTSGNVAWDGKTGSGKEASAGVYFYVIKATGSDGQTYNKKGTLTLVR